MILTINTTAAMIVRKLREDGVPVTTFTEPSEMEDGEIRFCRSAHVQVGAGYAVVYTEQMENGRLKTMTQVYSGNVYRGILAAVRKCLAAV